MSVVVVVLCCVCKYMAGWESGCCWSLNLSDCTTTGHHSITSLNRLVYDVTTMSLRCHYDVTTMSQTNIGFRHQSKISQIWNLSESTTLSVLHGDWRSSQILWVSLPSVRIDHFIRNIAAILRSLLCAEFECIMISILSTEFMECKNLIHFSILFPRIPSYISKKLYVL